MPVQAREHIHRGAFKILRGCHGIVCGWSATTNERETPQNDIIWNTLPEFIFVRFQTRTEWQLPGFHQKNVFPVSVARKPWYLDAGRANPKLKVTRSQFPLAPDFAGTTHALQGCTTEHGAIVDVQANADPIAVYVGMTRCRTRQKIMLYRSFPLAPFQAGLPLGRQLLLDVWKQEPIAWDALKQKYLDERLCMQCNENKRKNGFTKAQWQQSDYRVCRECTTQKRNAGTPYRCHQCNVWHATSHFPSKHLHPRCSSYRVCLSCEAKKQCFVRQKSLTKESFSNAAWGRRADGQRKCRACQRKTRGCWICVRCRQRKEQHDYSVYRRQHPAGQHGRQVCDTCYTSHVPPVDRQHAVAISDARLPPRRARPPRMQVRRKVRHVIADEMNASKPVVHTKPRLRTATAATCATDRPNAVAPKTPRTLSIDPLRATITHVRSGAKRSRAATERVTEQLTKKVKNTASETAQPHSTHGHALVPEVPVNPNVSQKRKRRDSRPETREVPQKMLAARTTETTGCKVTATGRTYRYRCPHCDQDVLSTAYSGKVIHGDKHCRKTFRVSDGHVCGRVHPRKCPQCGVTVYSTLPHGRLQITHKTRGGHTCPTTSWLA